MSECIWRVFLAHLVLGFSSGAAGESVELGEFEWGTDSARSAITGFVEAGGLVFFKADDGVHGTELWVSDGTGAGTRMVADIAPGDKGGNPLAMVAFEGLLYFIANPTPVPASASPYELWVSDGTEEGTRSVLKIGDAPLIEGEFDSTVWGGALYFGCGELWRSDGTAEGTSVVKDIDPSFFGISAPRLFAATPRLLFFVASDGIHGRELWATDGTEGGTRLIKDVREGGTSHIEDVVGAGDRVFFIADDGVHGDELWVSDGTEEGTRLVVDIWDGSRSGVVSSGLTALGEEVFFVGEDEIHGTELWASDGSGGGTRMLRDIRVGEGDGVGVTQTLEVWRGEVYFGAYGGELWKTDGRAGGTRMVKDAFEGFSTGGVRALYGASGGLFFEVGSRLWVSDGTEFGTRSFAEYGFGGVSLQFVGDGTSVYFSSDDGLRGSELWRSDGTAEGTVLLRDVFSRPNDGQSPVTGEVNPAIVGDDGMYYFAASDGVRGIELWKSDGSSGGTVLVKDIETGERGSRPRELANFDGEVFLLTAGGNGFTGSGLWRSDGTDGGTTLLLDGFSGRGLAVTEGLLFFESSQELWATDGTAENTGAVVEVRLSSSGVAFGGRLYFNALDEGRPRLWSTDGSAVGTGTVGGGFGLVGLTPVQDYSFDGGLYFGGRSEESGVSGLWRIDGESGGISLVTSNPRLGSSGHGFHRVGDVLCFSSFDAIWKTDGTDAGTELVRGFSSRPQNLVTLGGRLYFTADAEGLGAELWVTDGSDAGTRLVKDIYPGGGGSIAASRGRTDNGMVAAEGRLYFMANDGIHGMELWVSDGTDDGTRMVEDFALGRSSSWPTNLRRVRGRLVYAAHDGVVDVSLRAVELVAGEGFVLSVERGAGGTGLILSWPTVAGRLYQLELSVDLEVWVAVGGVVEGDGSVVSRGEAGLGGGFYRVVEREGR